MTRYSGAYARELETGQREFLGNMEDLASAAMGLPEKDGKSSLYIMGQEWNVVAVLPDGVVLIRHEAEYMLVRSGQPDQRCHYILFACAPSAAAEIRPEGSRATEQYISALQIGRALFRLTGKTFG